jgi:hypothetical protein
VYVDHRIITQFDGSGALVKIFSDQEIPVAWLKAHLGSLPGEGLQGRPHLTVRRGAIIVTQVHIEQITQYV